MALPKLLQKLFTNGGAGDKLNQNIIPDIPYSKITDVPSITVDSALSSTSENPVQNKVVKSALDGKLSTSGGTVSGSTIINQVSFPNAGNIRTTSMSTELLLNYGQGGWLTLLGKDFPRSDKGGFIIAAEAGNVSYSLTGLPSGSLTWGGASVWCGNAKWENRRNLTIGQSFTAPSRGFVYSKANSTSSWGALHTSVNGIHLLGVTGKETDTGGTVYVNAGDTVIVSRDGSVEHISVIFVPIQ